MTRQQLTAEWSIDVDDSFESRIVDEDLQMVSPGPPVRTIWLASWSSEPDVTMTQTERWIREDIDEAQEALEPESVEHFYEGSEDEGQIRVGSWYSEVSEDDEPMWALYGYTITPGGHMQAAFFSDVETDKQWALDTWHSLEYEIATDGSQEN